MDSLKEIELRVNQDTNIVNMFPDSKVVFGYGTGSNKIVIIGEAPAQKGGNITGEPFTSARSGKLMQEILDESNIRKDECFVSNICFCSPPNNRVPSYQEVSFCLPYLKNAIKVVDPKIVILVGRAAATYFLGLSFQWDKEYVINDHKYIAIYHPGYVLRQSASYVQDYKKKFKEVLQWVK